MEEISKTFRVFVSSTFIDMEEEWKALQERVFPRLEAFAVQHGCRFPVVDIRWGISEEAVINQQSMLITFREIFRCQDMSPHLNFIMLMGDRYGPQPLPLWITAGDFKTIIDNIGSDEQRELIREWYRPDNNSVTLKYGLQLRQDIYINPARWEPVEKKIRTILCEVFQKLSLAPDQVVKYTGSAVEREIYYGALNSNFASGQIFGFLRTFENINLDEVIRQERWRDFFDADSEDQIDKVAFNRQQELKKRLKKHLGENIFEYPAQWNDMGSENQRKRIDRLCDDFYNALSRAIEQEVKKFSWKNELYTEFLSHSRFCWHHGNPGCFVGSVEALAAIRRYIESGSTVPFVVYGPPGVGKSALLAHAVELLEDSYEQLVFRFIGVTPESTDIHPLLSNLCQHIVLNFFNGARMHQDYREMLTEFYYFLCSAAAKQPLIIFIDALDLLTGSNDGPSFDWLSAQLPPRVRFIVSIREDSPYRENLFKKIPSENRFKLSPLSTEERVQLLEKRLEASGRILQPEQRPAALEQFKRNGLPLYLDMSFEEIRLWRSYHRNLSMATDIHGLFQNLFSHLSAKGHHGPVLVSNVMGYLAAAKNGLREDEILDMLSTNPLVMEELKKRFPHLPEPNRFPPVSLWKLFSDLQPYLRERNGDSTVLISPVHRQFIEAASVELQEDKKLLCFHRELAHYFNAQPYFIDTPPNKRPNYRKLSELAYQQSCGHLWDEIEETLCRFDFIEAKCSAGMTDNLVDDYDTALENIEKELTETAPEAKQTVSLTNLSDRVKGFARFVHEQVDYFHRFGQIPGFCVQQAYNAYRDGPVAKAALSYLGSLPPELCLILHHEQDRKAYSPNPETSRVMNGHSNYVYCVVLSLDGKLALSGSQDEPILVWDVESSRCIKQLDGHIGRVKAIALSADGKTAISTGWDKTLRVWEVSSGECLKTIIASDDYIDTAALSADGKVAVIGDRDGNIGVWDIKAGELLHFFVGHRETVHAVTLSADGNIAVSSGGDRDIKVWDIRTGSLMKTIGCDSSGFIHSLALSPEGSLLVSGGDNQTVSTWDMDSGCCLKEMNGHTESVVSVAVSTDGRTAVSASKDRTIRVWDIKKGECLRILQGHSEYPKAVALSADARVAISGGDDQFLIAWNLLNNTPVKQEKKKDFHLDNEFYSMDGHVVVSGKYSKTLEIRNRASANGQHLIGVGEEIKVLNISPNGRIAVTAPWGSVLYLWDTEIGRCLGKLEGHSGNITAAALSVDGSMAISADHHGVLRVWDIETKTCLKIFPCRALAVAISPDGSFVLAGGTDKIIRVWHTATGTCLRKWEGHTGDIHAIALSLDGKLTFSVASDNTLRVWDLEKNLCIAVKGHYCEMTNLTIIDDYVKVSDSFGNVTTITLRNYTLPTPTPAEIRQLLAGLPNVIHQQKIVDQEKETEMENRSMRRVCSVCGYRVTMDTAKTRGITTMGNWDCLGRVYCYFFAEPVDPQERYEAKCPHWVSYEVLNFDTELEKGKVK